MDEGRLHRGFLFSGDIPLIFLKNRLEKKSNYDYSLLLSNLSDIGLDPSGKFFWSAPPPESLDDHDLKNGFKEVGRLAAQVSETLSLQSNTLIRHLVRVSVGCLAGQKRISQYFIPGVFKNRPYEKLLEQLVSDIRADDFDLGHAHGRILQLEKSKSTIASIVFPASIHRLCRTPEINLREQFGPLISATADIDDAIEQAALDAFYLVSEIEHANEEAIKSLFKRYLEGFSEYETLKSSKIKKEAAKLQRDLEGTVKFFHSHHHYDDQEKITIVRDAADAGMAQAQFALGEMLTFIDYPDKDFDAAAIFYLKAAKQNHSDAQWALSRLYLKGEGVIKSSEHALRWAIKAAENGLYSAVEELATGFLYGHREYFSGDLDQAEKWLSVLAESQIWLGETRYRAQAQLGVCHQKKGDLVEAYKWFLVSGLEVSADFNSSESRMVKTQEYELKDWNKRITESVEEVAKEMSEDMISTAKAKAADWWEERSLNPIFR